MSFFFSCLSFSSNWERERERERERGYIKLVIMRNGLKVYVSFFFDGVLWRIFLLLRANRLYLIFNTGLKKMASSCPRYPSSSFTRSTWLWLCPLRTLSNNWLFPFLFPLTGGSPHFRFRVPANRLASTFSCQVTRVRSPSINIWSPLWPIFFLNGHSLMACYC